MTNDTDVSDYSRGNELRELGVREVRMNFTKYIRDAQNSKIRYIIKSHSEKVAGLASAEDVEFLHWLDREVISEEELYAKLALRGVKIGPKSDQDWPKYIRNRAHNLSIPDERLEVNHATLYIAGLVNLEQPEEAAANYLDEAIKLCERYKSAADKLLGRPEVVPFYDWYCDALEKRYERDKNEEDNIRKQEIKKQTESSRDVIKITLDDESEKETQDELTFSISGHVENGTVRRVKDDDEEFITIKFDWVNRDVEFESIMVPAQNGAVTTIPASKFQETENQGRLSYKLRFYPVEQGANIHMTEFKKKRKESVE